MLFVVGRLKVDFRVPRSCVRWSF